MRYIAICLVCAWAFTGCIPSEAPDERSVDADAPSQVLDVPPATPQPQALPPGVESKSPEELLAEWEALAENPRENLSNPRVSMLGTILNAMGREHLDPMVDVLKDEGEDEAKKVLVAETLQNVMTPEWVDTLEPLTSEEHGNTTRAVATHLLALAGEPELKPLFQELAKDESSRVQLAAQQGLVLLGDSETSDQLFDMFFDEETSVRQKDHIAQTLSRFPKEKYLPVYREAFSNESFEIAARISAAVALGSTGGDEDIKMLETVYDKTESIDLKIAANLALEQLRTLGSESDSGESEDDGAEE